ncbi:MAG TPA: hypothetical protein VIL86_14675 [Tepidisphaeraceae bacterium]
MMKPTRLIALAAGAGATLFAAVAFAAPTQEEVFRSIQENVSEPADGGKVLGVIAAGAALLILLLLFSQRYQRKATPKALNHPGKLLKEVLKAVPIRGADIKRLKILAEQKEISSPLVLLLCPSAAKRR